MNNQAEESFRDSISTIDKQGKRAWVFPKKPKGLFYEKRKLLSYVLLVFLFSAPFVKINGNQFLLFNVIERRFNFFGFPFWPQDFYLVVISLVIGVVGLALFTVAFGRIFCGWVCPQTIFMEMVFRRIDYWIEGDRGAQIRLDKQAWNVEKIRKKGIKWLIYFVISFLIANVFTAYLIGSDKLMLYITEGPQEHVSTFITLIIFTAIFYFVFIWFREQVCIIACPYGRLQGVLLDNDSMVVAYDHVRGEKETGRSKWRKNEDRSQTGKGDCIDCKLCVHVCPTGIDIRNGTQLECINCTACIDECDTMMSNVGLQKGLIRYASVNEIEKKEKFKFTLRMKGYTAVLGILLSALIGLLFLRADLELVVLKIPGQLYQHKGENISNVYTYKILNKTNVDYKDVTFKLASPKGTIEVVGSEKVDIAKGELTRGTLFVEIHPNELEGNKTKIRIEIFNGNERIESTETNFLGPRSFY